VQESGAGGSDRRRDGGERYGPGLGRSHGKGANPIAAMPPASPSLPSMKLKRVRHPDQRADGNACFDPPQGDLVDCGDAKAGIAIVAATMWASRTGMAGCVRRRQAKPG
jgi:hypothetical protein